MKKSEIRNPKHETNSNDQNSKYQNDSNLKHSNFKRFLPTILIIFILVIGAFFRLYRIREYLTFLGDEGRDVLVVKRMIVDGKLTLLGPITSVGSIYMGPVYYYMMAPFLLLAGFDPVGPAVMVALFGVGTIALIYVLMKQFFDDFAALSASFLYAVSPLPILYGRASWNPNVVPFFATVLIYSLLQSCLAGKTKWLIFAGFALGILVQLHYVTFLFFPVIAIMLFLYRKVLNKKDFLAGFAAFLLSYSPFLIFELRHGFVNTLGAWRFLWQQKAEAAPGLLAIWSTIHDVSVRLFWRLVVVESAEITKIFMIFLAATVYIKIRNLKKLGSKGAVTILLVWLIVGIVSFGLYRGVIYDYYLGSLFTLPFIFTGIAISSLFQFKKYGKVFSLGILIVLALFNLKHSPLLTPPSNLMRNTQEAARFVFEQSQGLPYNFALIAGKNSDHAYRYFLELWGAAPVTVENPTIDPQRTTVTNQLFVVCEEEVCQPEGHPLWEIAGYGRAEIENEWKVATVRIFKLVPFRGYTRLTLVPI